jgi:3-oxoacyl-[acyl-carrier-protein] synthase-3
MATGTSTRPVSIDDESRTTPLRAAIASIGTSVPATIMPNEAIAARAGVTEDWIVRRTGIHSRRFAGAEESLTEHAAAAGLDALERAGVAAASIDLVLVATSTPDQLLPNAAPLVANAIGAAGAGAMDVGAACTGFLSALALASAQIEAGRADHVLVVGADLMSRVLDLDDRGTAPLFGDGAGAVVLTGSQNGAGIGPVVLGSDATGAGFIVIDRAEPVVRMNGHETFKEAVTRLTQATLEAADAADVGLDEIDLFVYHQANSRILRAVGERLELPADRVIDCIESYGNTSAATLPLALAFAHERGRLNGGERVLLGAFGAGFTWGATVIDWNAEAS